MANEKVHETVEGSFEEENKPHVDVEYSYSDVDDKDLGIAFDGKPIEVEKVPLEERIKVAEEVKKNLDEMVNQRQQKRG